MRHLELLIEQKHHFLSALHEGLTTGEIAARFDVNIYTVSHACKRLGISPPNGKRGPKPGTGVDPDRLSNIIAMRERGVTYQEIAELYGISRERVRQILQRCGRADLCYRQTKWNDPKEQEHCLRCGGVLPFQNRKRQKYCSKKCWSRSTKSFAVAKLALRRRSEGATWQKIADEVGWKRPRTIQEVVYRYRDLTGEDVSSAFGFRGGS